MNLTNTLAGNKQGTHELLEPASSVDQSQRSDHSEPSRRSSTGLRICVVTIVYILIYDTTLKPTARIPSSLPKKLLES